MNERIQDQDETPPPAETAPEPAEAEAGAAETGAADSGGADSGTDAPAEAEAAASEPDGERIAALEAEAADLRDRLLRAMADLDNSRKRAEREREQTRKYGLTGFARDLLNAADNLRRALDSVPGDIETADPAIRNLVLGVEMTEKELLGAFSKHGIRRIEPLGEAFDYNFHQAMFEIADDKVAPGTVVQVMQAGYVLADRLLRPAMVGVARAADGAGDAGAEPDAAPADGAGPPA